MNEIFNPTLVMSVGPFGKKALDFLETMISDIPTHFKELIYLSHMENLEKCENIIQNIVDEKLLCSIGINRLVDLGYKIRVENSSDIKINIYIFWDVYGSTFKVSDLINMIYKINYGNIDKSKASGVSLYIIPIIDREWLHSEEEIGSGAREIKKIINIISIPENIIFINSKMYLLHSISNDGTRIGETELESVCAIVTYLNILPSTQPPLACFNKRLLKHEGDFKIGTIGISSLSVFKEKVEEEFKSYLVKDLVNYITNNEAKINFKNYEGTYLLGDNYAFEKLKKGIPLINDPYIRLKEKDEFKFNFPKISIWKRDISKYTIYLKQWEEKVSTEYVEGIKYELNRKFKELLIQSKLTISKELNSVVLSYGLKSGKEYLNYILEQRKNGELKKNIIKNNKKDLDKKLKNKINNQPNFSGFIIKLILLILFMTYSLTNIFTANEVLSIIEKILWFILILGLILGTLLLDWFYGYKSLNKIINKYTKNVNEIQGSIVYEYMFKLVDKYREAVDEFILEQIKVIEECSNNINSINLDDNSNKKLEKYEFENLIMDLLDYEDRRIFYEKHSGDIANLYNRLIIKLEDFKLLRETKISEVIYNFSENIAVSRVNIDFYEFIKSKWGENRDEEICNWIDKGLIKSKELLQFNEDNDIEKHKLFLASKDFISYYKNMLNEKINTFELIPIDGKDVFTNCISLIKISLGIKFDNITPFMKIKEDIEK